MHAHVLTSNMYSAQQIYSIKKKKHTDLDKNLFIQLSLQLLLRIIEKSFIQFVQPKEKTADLQQVKLDPHFITHSTSKREKISSHTHNENTYIRTLAYSCSANKIKLMPKCTSCVYFSTKSKENSTAQVLYIRLLLFSNQTICVINICDTGSFRIGADICIMSCLFK